MKKWFIVIIVVVVIGLIIFFNVRGTNKVQVETEVVKKGDVSKIVSSTGKITAAEEVNISSDIMGKVIKLYVKEGENVKAGQVLAKLDDTDAKASYDKAVSYYESQKTNYSLKKSDFERKKVLYEKNLISKKEYEDAESSLLMAENTLKQAEADVISSKNRLDKCTIISPIDAIVTKIKVKEGENVITGTMNNPGTVLFVLSNVNDIDLVADVNESEVPIVSIGDSVMIDVDAFPNKKFSGYVYDISKYPTTSSTGVVTYPVKIRIIDKDIKFYPGMTGNCEIIVDKKKDVINIPLRGMIKKKGSGVFLYKNGIAKFKEIKIGLMGDLNVEVVEGLNEGDTIITGPFKILKELKDGQRVFTGNSSLRHNFNKGE